jgi:hypothetical protein
VNRWGPWNQTGTTFWWQNWDDWLYLRWTGSNPFIILKIPIWDTKSTVFCLVVAKTRLFPSFFYFVVKGILQPCIV